LIRVGSSIVRAGSLILLYLKATSIEFWHVTTAQSSPEPKARKLPPACMTIEFHNIEMNHRQSKRKKIDDKLATSIIK